jgi:hypothetical protein
MSLIVVTALLLQFTGRAPAEAQRIGCSTAGSASDSLVITFGAVQAAGVARLIIRAKTNGTADRRATVTYRDADSGERYAECGGRRSVRVAFGSIAPEATIQIDVLNIAGFVVVIDGIAAFHAPLSVPSEVSVACSSVDGRPLCRLISSGGAM